MKRMKFIILAYIGFSLLLSCNKDGFLDRKPTNTIPQSDIFKSSDLINAYLNDLYLDVPGYERNLYGNIADEARTYWPGGSKDVVRGNWGPRSNLMAYWPYDDIRKCNTFLMKIGNSDIGDSIKNEYIGQVKFLRALQYFKMIKRYGGIPIITKPQELTDDLLVEKQSIDSCFNFVINELEGAIELLPNTYGNADIDVGRANKWSAKAFLGRVLLFWASPLYNPKGDVNRWGEAAEVNLDVIENGPYSLYPDFRKIMLAKNNQEEIFSIQYLKPYREHGWDSWSMPDSRSRQDASDRCPLQELVDAFPMKNGIPITSPLSGYDPTHPYDNRDPRLQQTVIVNGSTYGFQGLPVYMYVDGIDGIGKPYETVTGYQLRKGTDESNQDYYGQTGSDQNWIELRFAEVLLNYAEAKNEFLGSPDNSIYDAIDRIRERAGLNPYQVPTGLTKKEMREEIRNERYIELAFERKRYWDLKRWMTAVERLNGNRFHGMYITKHSDGHYTYEVKPVGETYVFTDKMYFMPFSQDDIDKDPNLAQNPGW